MHALSGWFGTIYYLSNSVLSVYNILIIIIIYYYRERPVMYMTHVIYSIPTVWIVFPQSMEYIFYSIQEGSSKTSFVCAALHSATSHTSHIRPPRQVQPSVRVVRITNCNSKYHRLLPAVSCRSKSEPAVSCHSKSEPSGCVLHSGWSHTASHQP